MQSIVVVVVFEYCCPASVVPLFVRRGAPSNSQRLHHYQHCQYHCYQHQHHQRIVGCPQVVPLIVRRATHFSKLQTTSHSACNQHHCCSNLFAIFNSLSSFLSSYLNHHLSPPSPLGQIVQQKLDTTLLSEDKQKASLGKTNQSSYSCRLPQMGQRGKKQTTRIIQSHQSHQQHQHCHQYQHHKYKRPIICVS